MKIKFLDRKKFLYGSVSSQMSCISVNQYLRHKLGYKKYKLFDITKFILVLPTFRLIQQSLSRTRCLMKSLHFVLKLLSNGK